MHMMWALCDPVADITAFAVVAPLVPPPKPGYAQQERHERGAQEEGGSDDRNRV